jgi:2-(1,2-epoxy-1,2-dihydrophenyl)acetyl-CoA isomerase
MTGYVTRTGRVLTAVVATADAGGSLCEPALDALRGELRGLAADPAARAGPAGIGAVLLVSQNRNFCTGGDITAFAAAADPAVEVRRQAEALHAVLLAMIAAPVPVVAAVNGWAAGAGMSLICQCDLAVAGVSTRLRPGYPSIGFSPDGGLTWTLPRIVGAGRAREILYTDRALDAPEALALGLVHRVVPDEQVGAEAAALAEQLAAGPAGAFGRIKELLAASADRDLPAQLAAEAAAVSRGAATGEGREGVAAFLQRRQPQWHQPMPPAGNTMTGTTATAQSSTIAGGGP